MNYFLQVFVKERGEWKIAESVVAPTEQIVQNGDGFGMKEEMVYGDREDNLLFKRRLFHTPRKFKF